MGKKFGRKGGGNILDAFEVYDLTISHYEKLEPLRVPP